MARQYRANARKYASSGYSGAKRYGGRAYTGYNKGRKAANAGIKLRLGNEWLAGVAIGVTNLDDRIPTELKLAGATMPVGGKYGGKGKAVCQGMIFGNLVQHYLKFRTGGSTSSGDGI